MFENDPQENCGTRHFVLTLQRSSNHQTHEEANGSQNVTLKVEMQLP